MKTMMKVAAVAAGVLCLASCTKERTDMEEYYWMGEYPVQTVNGTTGETEDHTGYIVLYFEKEGTECIVETGISGLIAANRVTYWVQWNSENSFTLFETAGGQSLSYYSGVISGNAMELDFLNCDGIARTCSLSRYLRALLIN